MVFLSKPHKNYSFSSVGLYVRKDHVTNLFYLCRQTRQGMNIRFIEAHSAERPLLSTHAQGRAEHVFGDLKCPCPSEIFP